MKIWNTKYCLTDGITEHEVKETNDNYVMIPAAEKSYGVYLHGEGKEWHRSKASAIVRANEVKIKKLQSLDRQIQKISSIEFDS